MPLGRRVDKCQGGSKADAVGAACYRFSMVVAMVS